jgi:hypothetical protein
MKKIEFNRTVFRDGVPEFEQGKQYDVTEVTTREVRRGNAAEVLIPELEHGHVDGPAAKRSKKKQ